MWDAHCLHYTLLAARSMSTLVTPQCNSFKQCVTVHPVPKCWSCHKAIMVITRRAHCYPLDRFRLYFCFKQNLDKSASHPKFNMRGIHTNDPQIIDRHFMSLGRLP